VTKRRRKFSDAEVLATLLHQAVKICCFRCGEPFDLGRDFPPASRPADVQREHLHEIALGGPDEPSNCRFSHASCHAVVTNGTPATTAGSSKNRIAKATNSKRIDKFKVNKRPLDADLDEPTPAHQRCRKCGRFDGDCQC
jgi:hypothetical protein